MKFIFENGFKFKELFISILILCVYVYTHTHTHTHTHTYTQTSTHTYTPTHIYNAMHTANSALNPSGWVLCCLTYSARSATTIGSNLARVCRL